MPVMSSLSAQVAPIPSTIGTTVEQFGDNRLVLTPERYYAVFAGLAMVEFSASKAQATKEFWRVKEAN